ncbi:hypothetical protein DSECCO2_548330 [anaerobic digester metagenome]
MQDLAEGKPERRAEVRPPFHPVLHPYRTAVTLDEGADDEETESVAAPLGPPPIVSVKERLLHGVRDTRTGILDGDEDVLAVVILHPDDDLDVRTPEPDGTPDEV